MAQRSPFRLATIVEKANEADGIKRKNRGKHEQKGENIKDRAKMRSYLNGILRERDGKIILKILKFIKNGEIITSYVKTGKK